MNENQSEPKNLIDTTDCLEAIGVFKCWKNTLFAITILLLLLTQASFWLVNTGFVKTEPVKVTAEEKPTESVIKQDSTATVPKAQTETAPPPDKIQQAAKIVAGEPNQPIPPLAEAIKKQPTSTESRSPLALTITFSWLSRFIRLLDFVLIPVSILYCLTMLFSLKVSLLGRLGGINHISRAFFLSLIFVVLLMPWQILFKGFFAGAIFTPHELATAYTKVQDKHIFSVALFYGRFCGYWLVVLLLLIMAQIRSGRWASAILRRLEVI